jgi:hypothetical protein
MVAVGKSFLSGDEMDHSEVKHLKVDHTPAVLDELSVRLLKAASHIEDHGWCQNTVRTTEGRVCVAGAIFAVTNNDANPDPLRNCMFAAFRVAIGCAPDGGGIPNWNDQPGRTKDEAVAKLRAVALGL